MMIHDIPEYNGPGIYKLRNLSNGKLYIGSTKKIRNRIISHERTFETLRCNKKLREDVLKGCDFIVEIIETLPVGITKPDLLAIEGKYIKQFDSIEKGYNVANTSEDKKRAVKRQAKWEKANLERIVINIRKDRRINKEVIEKAAKAMGISVTALVKDAIKFRIESERKLPLLKCGEKDEPL